MFLATYLRQVTQTLSEDENKQNLNINKLRKALEKVLIPLSPQYHLVISDLQNLHPILHPKM